MIEKNNFDDLSTEEIKQKLTEVKNKIIDIKKPKVKIDTTKLIDKYTGIDELLYETLQRLNVLIDEQEETNRQLQINNRLLLSVALEEAEDGTIRPRTGEGIDTSAILSEIGGSGNYRTLIKNIPNQKIDNNKTVFETIGNGIVSEILFKSSTSSSDNKSYSVKIRCDEKNIYQDSFTNFESRNYFEPDMTCYEDTQQSKYILVFKNIAYEDSLVIDVYQSSATFDQIYIKYQTEV